MTDKLVQPNDMTSLAMKDIERSINEISFNIANGGKQRFNSIHISEFEKFFWPWFSGKVEEEININGTLYNHRVIWLDKVAGSPFLAVNILDNDGNIVAVVPPIADTGILNGENMRTAGKSKVEANALATIVNNNTHVVNKGHAMLVALNDRYSQVIKNATPEYVRQMELLFNFFGESMFNKTADEINAANVNNKSAYVAKSNTTEQVKQTKVDDGMGW